MNTLATSARHALPSIFAPSRLALLALLASAAGCSSAAGEDTASTTGAYTTRGAAVDSSVASFQAANSNIAYALDTSGRLWVDTVSPHSHLQVDANVKAFQPIVGGGWVYVLGTDGNLWLEPNQIAGRVFTASGVTAFQTLGLGKILRKDASNNLWYQIGAAGAEPPLWVDGNVNRFRAVDTTAIYVLGNDAKLWNENGTMANRKPVDSNVAQFFPADATHVYVEGSDGNLWNENGDSSHRTQVDSEVVSFYPVDARTVYVEGVKHNLWREVQSHYFADEIDGTVMGFQPAGPQAAWVLGSDGNLWFEQLPPAALVFDESTSTTTASLGVWPNGNALFMGTATSGDVLPESYAIGMELNNATGQEFTFATQVSLSANLPGGHNSASFSVTGTNPELAAYFGSLQQSAHWDLGVETSIDWGAVWNILQQGYSDGKQVWSVIGPVLSGGG